MIINPSRMITKSRKPGLVTGKRGDRGRFVTLQSGQTIFIPEGYKSKWADVQGEILPKVSPPGRWRELRGYHGSDFSSKEWASFADRWEGQARVIRETGSLSDDEESQLDMQAGFIRDIAIDAKFGMREKIAVAAMSEYAEDYVPEAVGIGWVEEYGELPPSLGKSGAFVIDKLATAPKNSPYSSFSDKVRGGGTMVMREFAKKAAADGLGMVLYAAPQAAGFYKKLGFEPERGLMVLSPERTRRLADAEIGD